MYMYSYVYVQRLCTRRYGGCICAVYMYMYMYGNAYTPEGTVVYVVACVCVYVCATPLRRKVRWFTLLPVCVFVYVCATPLRPKVVVHVPWMCICVCNEYVPVGTVDFVVASVRVYMYLTYQYI